MRGLAFLLYKDMKKIKIYDSKSGYFNAENVITSQFKFIFVTGARGTGKTFSTLLYLIKKNIKTGKPFIYLRRTQDESDLQANENTSSITKVLKYLDLEYSFGKLSKKVGVIYVNEKPLIYTAGLRTFASIRGVNFDDVNEAIYDEFICEPHVPSFKAEGMALMNFYESVNRNRELEGDKPLKLICLSNSLNIANDTFMEFDLVTPAENLTTSGDEIYIRNDILLIIMQDSPISRKKAQTSLYQNASEEYSAMAINNKFILNDFTYVKHRSLKEYRILFQVGDLYFYKHKNKYEYYCTFSKSITKKVYSSGVADLERFRRAEWKYYVKYLDGYVTFDTYKAIALFEKYYK